MLDQVEFERACRESSRSAGWVALISLGIWTGGFLFIVGFQIQSNAFGRTDPTAELRSWLSVFMGATLLLSLALPSTVLLMVLVQRRADRDQRFRCPKCSKALFWDQSKVKKTGRCSWCNRRVFRIDRGTRLLNRLRIRALAEAWPQRRKYFVLFLVVLTAWVVGSILLLTLPSVQPFPGFIGFGLLSMLVIGVLVWRIVSPPRLHCSNCGIFLMTGSLTNTGHCGNCGHVLIELTGVAGLETAG